MALLVEALDPKIFLQILPSATDIAAVNSTGTNKLLANSVSTFFIIGNLMWNYVEK